MCGWPVGPWLLAFLVALGAFGVVGGVAWGSGDNDEFSTSVHEGRSGAMSLSVGSESGSLGVASHDIAAGDTIERLVSLTMDKKSGVKKVQLRVLDMQAPPTVLSTEAANGLQVVIEACAGPPDEGWAPAGAAGTYKYACRAKHGQSTVVSQGSLYALIARGTLMLPHLNRTGITHLRVTLSLPRAAGDEFQNKTAQVRFVFSGVVEGSNPG